MMKRKQPRRARNKIAGSAQGALGQGALVKVEPVLEPPVELRRVSAVIVARPTLFTAELEEAIDLIARERVYRAYLDRLGRRLLARPAIEGDLLDA